MSDFKYPVMDENQIISEQRKEIARLEKELAAINADFAWLELPGNCDRLYGGKDGFMLTDEYGATEPQPTIREAIKKARGA